MTCRVFLDTNVLIDIIVAERDDHGAAQALFDAATSSRLDACVCPLSLKDAYYIATKAVGEPAARKWVEALLAAFEVADVTRATCEEALSCGEGDFEDGLVRAAAVSSLADVIVTRGATAFATAPFERLALNDLVARL